MKKKENKISMRVSDQYMRVITVVSEYLGINKTEAIIFVSSLGYGTFTGYDDMVSKYAKFKEN